MMTETTAKKRFEMKYVHCAVTLIIIFGSHFVPAMAPLTKEGMAVLGAFIGAVYGWSTIDMLWPSIMGLLGLGLATNMTTVLAAGFGNNIVVMLFLLFAIIALLNQTNALDVMANKFVNNKLTAGKPWLFIYVFFIGMGICGLLMSGLAAIVVFMAILWKLCKQLDYKPYSPFPTTMVLGLALSTMLAAVIIPFKGNAIALMAAYNAMRPNAPMDFARYMLFMIPMFFILVFVYLLIMRFVFRVDVSKLKNLTADSFGTEKNLNTEQKMAFGFLLLVVLVFLSPTILPKTWALTTLINRLTMFGQVAIIAGVMMLLKKSDGTPFFPYGRLAAGGVSWECIFMCAFVMPVSSMLTAETTGITPWINGLIAPMTQLNPLVFVLMIMFFATVITNFAQNVVLAIIIMPVLINFSVQVGLNTAALTLIMILCTSFALLTPGASAFTAMIFANPEWVKAKHLMAYAAVTIIILFIVLMLIGIPLANIIFK